MKIKPIVMILLFGTNELTFASEPEKGVRINKFQSCESTTLGKVYEYMSGKIATGEESFRVEVQYIGDENEYESIHAFININEKFKYDMGLYSGCGLENNIDYVWVETVPQGYRVFWRVLHTGQGVPEDYQGVILSADGKFIEKYHHDPSS